MSKIRSFLIVLILCGFSISFTQAKELSSPTALKLGWEVSCQTYAFQGLTFCEMIDKLSSMGILNIEGLNQPGLKLSKTDGTIVDYKMPNDKLQEMIDYMAEKGMKMPSYFVGWQKDTGPDNWVKDRKLWEFLKKLEVKVLCCEMKAGELGSVKGLSQEFNIPIAIHNHTSGVSPVYYDPQKAIKALDDAGELPHVGFCPDIGQWERSNLDVMKGLIAYHKSRPIHVLHARDIRHGSSADTALGMGKIPCKEVLDSLYAWKWKGIITFDPDLRSNNYLRLIDSSAHFVENFAKSKDVTPISSYMISPCINNQRTTGVFVTTGNDFFDHKNRDIVLYTLTGKMLGNKSASIPVPGSNKARGVYIIR